MSRCYICNYSDVGLSDIPIDDRKVDKDVCSKCSEEPHYTRKDSTSDPFSGTIGGIFSEHLDDAETSVEPVPGVNGLPTRDDREHGPSINPIDDDKRLDSEYFGCNTVVVD